MTGNEALERVRHLLKHFRTAMMVTIEQGALRSRPMGLVGEAADFDGILWFFADRTSHKVDEIERHASLSLVFQNDDASAYMHLYGRATVVDDRARITELYTPLLKTWFPDGADDPRLTLIRFDADHGEFWDSPGGMLQVLAAFTKAIVTGTPGKIGETSDVSL